MVFAVAGDVAGDQAGRQNHGKEREADQNVMH